MGYEEALEAAGAKVHDFMESGDYQGTWYAIVEYKGETGLVTGDYGSCSGCDAFQDEFGWSDDEKDGYQERLADFGRQYLGNIVSFDNAIANVEQYTSWDLEADKLLEWLKERKNERQ